MSGPTPMTPPGAMLMKLSRAGWDWLQSRRRAELRPGRLRVAEVASLGDKRLVAVVELDGSRFLIGCGPAQVTLLAQLGTSATVCAEHETAASGPDFRGVFDLAMHGEGVSA